MVQQQLFTKNSEVRYMFSSFFWDLDGTLYNTYPKMVESFSETLDHFGVSVDKNRVYKIMRQGSLGDAFDTFGAENGLNRHDLEEVYYPLEKKSQKPELFHGVKDILKLIKQSNGNNFLLTHRNGRSLYFMNNDNITDLFTDFVTADQPFPRKPDPTSLNYLIGRNRVNRNDAVMVGDRNLDVDAGHNANIAGILFDPDHIIDVNSNPEYQIENMAEIQSLIKK